MRIKRARPSTTPAIPPLLPYPQFELVSPNTGRYRYVCCVEDCMRPMLDHGVPMCQEHWDMVRLDTKLGLQLAIENGSEMYFEDCWIAARMQVEWDERHANKGL